MSPDKDIDEGVEARWWRAGKTNKRPRDVKKLLKPDRVYGPGENPPEETISPTKEEWLGIAMYNSDPQKWKVTGDRLRERGLGSYLVD